MLAVTRDGDEEAAPGVEVSNPIVGEDLHSLIVAPNDPNTLYIGSHQALTSPASSTLRSCTRPRQPYTLAGTVGLRGCGHER